MLKKQLYITERQNGFLKQEAEQLQIGFAELLRRILDEHIHQQEKKLGEIKQARK